MGPKPAVSKKSAVLDLYEVLQSEKGTGVAARAKVWGESAKSNFKKAVRDMIILLLRSCGLSLDDITLPSGNLDDKETISEIVNHLTNDVQENGLAYEGPGDYPILCKKYKDRFFSFWKKCIDHCKEYLLFRDYVLNSISYWLLQLSGSNVRAFRHTASVLGMEFVHILVSIMNENGRTKEAKEKQLRATKDAKLKQNLTEQLEILDSRIQICVATTDSLFKGIYIQKYRDIVPEIRRDLVHALGRQIYDYPHMFLQNTYVKYLGWALYDKDKDVRLAAISQLKILYSSEETSVKLDLFTSRHKPRLLEMLHDISPPVVCKTVDLLIYFQQSGLLDQDETQIVVSMINSVIISIRESVANFIATSVIEKKEGLKGLISHIIDFSENPTFVVDALWPKLPFLQDWRGYFKILSKNDGGEGDDSFSEQEKICLAKVFVLAVRKFSGDDICLDGKKLKVLGKDKSKGKESSSPEEIADDLHKLLEMYQAEPLILAELSQLPFYFSEESFSKSIESVVRTLVRSIENSFEEELLASAVKSLDKLSRGSFKGAKDAFDQLKETFHSQLSGYIKTALQGKKSKKPLENLRLYLKKAAIFISLSSPSPVDYWNEIENLYRNIPSDPEISQLSIRILFYSLLHSLSEYSDLNDRNTEKAQELSRKKTFLEHIFKKGMEEETFEVKEQIFSLWVSALVAFGNFKSFGSVDVEIVKIFMDFLHNSLHNEEIDLHRRKMILLKICTLLVKGCFSLLEHGSEALYYYSTKYEGKYDDILKATILHSATKNNCLDDLIFNTLLKIYVGDYLDEHENNPGEEVDQIYEEFLKTASKFSSSYISINLKRTDADPLIGSLRKSLIRLIKLIIQFGFQDIEKHTDFIGILDYFVFKVPTTGETEAGEKCSADAKICLDYMEGLLSKAEFENPKQRASFEAVFEVVGKKAGVISSSKGLTPKKKRNIDRREVSKSEGKEDADKAVTSKSRLKGSKQPVSRKRKSIVSAIEAEESEEEEEDDEKNETPEEKVPRKRKTQEAKSPSSSKKRTANYDSEEDEIAQAIRESLSQTPRGTPRSMKLGTPRAPRQSPSQLSSASQVGASSQEEHLAPSPVIAKKGAAKKPNKTKKMQIENAEEEVESESEEVEQEISVAKKSSKRKAQASPAALPAKRPKRNQAEVIVENGNAAVEEVQKSGPSRRSTSTLLQVGIGGSERPRRGKK